jgi:hypothetical protein
MQSPTDLEFSFLSLKSRILVLRALSALGCLVFIFSITSPFLFARYPNSIVPEDVNATQFWSFKSYNEQYIPGLRVAPRIYENWFCDFWIKESVYRSEFLALLPFMFVAQLLTLTTGVTSILVKKKLLIYFPLAFCSMVLALMTYISMSSKVNWNWQYQEGYWLTLLSIVAFLTVSLLSYAWARGNRERNAARIGTPTHV